MVTLQFSDWGTGFFNKKRGERDGTMDEFNTKGWISNLCIILSLAPARNETCRHTRCPCFLKDEVNFTNKSRIRHGTDQLIACLKLLLPL
jgi:hypothetical protein